MRKKRIGTFLAIVCCLGMVLNMQTVYANEQIPFGLYSGITIDGDFSDWNTISKVQNYHVNMMEAAMVWDRDYLYIYLKENPDWYQGNLHLSTPYSNGNFCIETDMGYKSSIFILGPNSGEPSAKINGESVEIKYSNAMYEVAVPVEKIYGYNEKTKAFHFGTIGDMNYGTMNYVITGVSNWNPQVTEPELPEDDEKEDIYDRNSDIRYDYDFADWEEYPHTTIDYSTGGAHGADAEGALYSDGDYLYGHIMYYGAYYNDIFNYFELARDEHYNQVLQLSAKVIDSNGNPVNNYNMYGLPKGTYEFHIFGPETIDGGAWSTDYGMIYLEVNATGQIHSEFRIEQSKIAHFYKTGQDDLKSLHMRFIRIGDKWISCAGTSTGPITGIALCSLAVVTGIWLNRKKKQKEDEAYTKCLD